MDSTSALLSNSTDSILLSEVEHTCSEKCGMTGFPKSFIPKCFVRPIFHSSASSSLLIYSVGVPEPVFGRPKQESLYKEDKLSGSSKYFPTAKVDDLGHQERQTL